MLPSVSSKTPETSKQLVSSEVVPSLSSHDNPWRALREILRWLVDGVGWKAEQAPNPLGRWLAEDIVLAADETSGGVAKHSALMLGMAQSTFRRHLNKARERLDAGTSIRSKDWLHVQSIIPELVNQSEREAGEDIVIRARRVLLEEVVIQVEEDDKLGATLMGVTLPTYRTWKQQLQSEQQDSPEPVR